MSLSLSRLNLVIKFDRVDFTDQVNKTTQISDENELPLISDDAGSSTLGQADR